MQLARLGKPGREIPVAISEGVRYDLRQVTADIDGAFLAMGGIERVREALAARQLAPLPEADGMRVGAPIARPQSVICIGQNYAEHARESGAPPPTTPIVFLKTPNTVVGPNDPVAIPRGSEKTDWEVELAVVIGSPAHYLESDDEAFACIAGYTACDDVSERAFQMEQSGGQWSKGKISFGFNPTGPVLVPADEFDPADVRVRSWVNGEARQDSRTSDLIFTVPFLVRHLSQYCRLEAGDLILTGTPQGVAFGGKFPYLRCGDVVEIEIDGIGRQRHEFINWTGE